MKLDTCFFILLNTIFASEIKFGKSIATNEGDVANPLDHRYDVPYRRLNSDLIPNLTFTPVISLETSHLQRILRLNETSDDPDIRRHLRMVFDASGKYEVLNQDLDDDREYVLSSALPPELFDMDVDVQWQAFECLEPPLLAAESTVSGQDEGTAVAAETSCYLLPHRDSRRSAAINFYYSVHDEVTAFYHNAVKSLTRGEVDTEVLYLRDWVTQYDSFQAQQGEVYLLDVSQIHGVLNLKVGERRLLLSLSFNESYSNMLQALQDYIIM